MQKIGNKEFDSANPRAYKRASRRGDLNLLPAGVRASGRFLTSWIERRDAWAAVRASDACWTRAQTHLTTLSLLPSSGNRYAFVFGILTLSVRRGPQGPKRMGEVNLRV